MINSISNILTSGFLHLYPYPYKTFAFVVTALATLIAFLPFYGIYLLIVRKYGAKAKKTIILTLKIAGIIFFTLFFTEITVSLITIHQVNRQLGFNYATPETPEGEPFLITKVVPGQTMDKAGLKPDDVVQMWSVNKLYRLLVNNEGKEVSFQVVRDNREITIKVKVPDMRLPLRKVALVI